jgi:RimJ/RimL family protein N-acetyltransferase
MSNVKTIDTSRLILQQSNIKDAAFFLELLNTTKWLLYIGDRNVHSIKDAEKYITERMLPQFNELGYGNYTVIRKTDGIKIGSCGLYNREGVDGVDIGFAFLPTYESLGYAFESAQALLNISKNKLKLSKISALTTEENLQSQRLIEKLGLKFIKKIKIPNDSETLRLYTITF